MVDRRVRPASSDSRRRWTARAGSRSTMQETAQETLPEETEMAEIADLHDLQSSLNQYIAAQTALHALDQAPEGKTLLRVETLTFEDSDDRSYCVSLCNPENHEDCYQGVDRDGDWINPVWETLAHSAAGLLALGASRGRRQTEDEQVFYLFDAPTLKSISDAAARGFAERAGAVR